MNLKEQAAIAALTYIRDGMVIGLGTGSTSEYFLTALSQAIKQKRLKDIKGIPTSRACQAMARELEIPLLDLKDHPTPDIAVDGADEIDPELNLIKGLGGALLREKIVESSVRQLIVIADESKAVSILGTKGPLPVEVATFAHETHIPFFRSLGAEPILRRNPDNSPYLTDNGNYIYHLSFNGIANPAQLQTTLKQRVGIIETGLFIGIATVALIAGTKGLITRQRPIS